MAFFHKKEMKSITSMIHPQANSKMYSFKTDKNVEPQFSD